MPKPTSRLTKRQINQLESQGCSAESWQTVSISKGSDLSRIVDVRFSGTVRVGNTKGRVSVDGVEMPCGIYHAAVSNTKVGDHARISMIGSVISNYEIQEGAVIENVASLIAEPGSAFGNGVELETINEAGGRGVKIINDLTSQVAYAQAMLRHNPGFIARLSDLVDKKAASAKAPKGIVGANARVLHCGPLRNVAIGPFASLRGVRQMENGTVNSCAEHPSEVGDGVIARSFILSEGARVDSGAILDKAFVGQGVRMGKQFSAENSLFFANCEAFHGEAVSLFAGPYTVTHHKSTLLIAGIFSFYNAGSASNQSNHMYKLGPVHQGILERGCKTGSSSYLMWEAHIGAFSVVIGKHYVDIDSPELPFSYFFEGKSSTVVLPARSLCSIGTVRDGEKWPQRDHRKAPVKRDLIIFDVYSPYTVEKMRRGRAELQRLNAQMSGRSTSVDYKGLHIESSHLQRGIEWYGQAVGRYLNGKVAQRMASALEEAENWTSVLKALTSAGALKRPKDWTDLSGLLTPVERMEMLEREVEDGRLSSYDQILSAFQSMYELYEQDQWQYVTEAFAEEYSLRPDQLTKERAAKVVEDWVGAEETLHRMVADDGKKEFDAFAHSGFGIDRSEEDARRDFEAVRGSAESNSVLRKLEARQADVRKARTRYLELISSK